MTSDFRRRRRRHKLKAHDRGENRHNKGLTWMLKVSRQRAHHRAERGGPGER